MKPAKLFSGLFALLGAALIAGTVMLSFHSLDTPVRLLVPSEAAANRTEELMEAICRGDYTSAGNMMYSQPDLNAAEPPSSALGSLLWDAFHGSLSYAFKGACYATDSGIARDVTITSLNIADVMALLKERTQTLLEQRVAEAADMAEIYDENNNYQEAFVMDVLCDAATQILAEDDFLISQDITLNLIYQDGQWWVIAEQQLINAISGSVME